MSGVETDQSFRLDDLYKMTAYIYSDGNLGRSKEATLLHFVEVCGMLTLIDRKKRRDRVDIPDALCKALGWYFPLLAKMGVESVERLLFLKYPGVCPYCRKAPHVEGECKLVKGTARTVAHAQVNELTEANWKDRPCSLNDWQEMFGRIYPRSLNTQGGFSTIALLEEIGELAEAVRVFDRYPHYFYGEAADVFSYIMGLANEYQLKLAGEEKIFNFEREYISRYPGLCIGCGARVCICPTVPQATVGRMAKEMPIGTPAPINAEAFAGAGKDVGQRVLESVGRVPGLSNKLPYDRGEMNSALTQMAFRLAAELSEQHRPTADRLTSLAIDLTRDKRESGTEASRVTVDVLDTIKEGWLKADPVLQKAIASEQPVFGEIAVMLQTRLLIVTTNADGTNRALRLDREVRKILERIRNGKYRDKIKIEHIMAATIDDLRVSLLSTKFDIIHFAGHATREGLEFDSSTGPVTLAFDNFSKMLRDQSNLLCVVLNACDAMQGITTAFAPLVVAMVDIIHDDEAVVFATGFYDALAAGRTPEEAYDIGVVALSSAELSSDAISKLSR